MADGAGSQPLDALIVGAGFSGLYMLHKLRGLGLRARVIEAGSGVGGTWYWNTYPGARCDIPSVEYSYSFSPELEREWRWSERYAAQPEILSYLEHVAERFDLKKDITFDTRVAAARWEEESASWTVELHPGGAVRARHLILAVGCLSSPKLPDLPGIERFAGEVVHTGKWRDEIKLEGEAVAVVGTGSSGVQVIPQIARIARSVTVLQRTPSYAVPASNHPLTEEVRTALRPQLACLREHARHSPLGWFTGPRPGSAKAAAEAERARRFEEQWNAGTTGLLLSYEDLLFDEASNATAADFARAKIAELVKDPDTARRLMPGYPIGARRLCSEIGYYEAMNRDNVRLVDVREEPIVGFTKDAVVTSARSYPIDVLVCATGFYALTGAITAIEISGRDGRSLREEWADGPRSYLGLAAAGFPNLFMMAGPGSPAVFSNVVVSIEQHVEWIADCLADLRARGAAWIEATEQSEIEWAKEMQDAADRTLLPRTDSWYQWKKRDGRRVLMPYLGGVGAYRERCREIAQDGYRGFAMSPSIPA